MMRVSVGVMAYNEEKNIGHLLDLLQAQELTLVRIGEICVVSSGKDRTNEIVRGEQKESSIPIRLIVEPERRGKASALNQWLGTTTENICVMCNADILPRLNSIEELSIKLLDPDVGMVGAHLIPMNDGDNFTAFCSILIYNLIHDISLTRCIMGEYVAFRHINGIPADTTTDESQIEMCVTKRYKSKIAYAPDAIAFNRGPEKLSEFMKRERRLAAGRVPMIKKYGYRATSAPRFCVLKAIIRQRYSFKQWLWVPCVLSLAMFCRILGYYDGLKGKKPYIWDISQTTKEVVR